MSIYSFKWEKTTNLGKNIGLRSWLAQRKKSRGQTYMQQQLSASYHQVQVYYGFLNVLISLPCTPGGRAGLEYLKSSKYNSVLPTQWCKCLASRVSVVDLAKASSSLERPGMDATLSFFLLCLHGCFNHPSEAHGLSFFLFFFFLRKISPELTAANPPLFAEEDWP